jgi:RNA polymerase sigma factor (sigma-70 family)
MQFINFPIDKFIDNCQYAFVVGTSEYRARLKAKGRCLNHPSESRPCPRCKALSSSRRALAVRSGMCPACGARPPKEDRSLCDGCLKKAAQHQARKQAQRKASGLCLQSGCKGKSDPPHALCKTHREQLRKYADARWQARKARGLCRQCDRPSIQGQTYCLVHRIVKEPSSLPYPVRRALREARKQERQSERNAQAKAQREFVERHINLIDNERARSIMRMRYGHTEAECLSLQEVGKQFGITRERVRQIQQLAEDRILMFSIEKNIPIPQRGQGKASELRETLKTMGVGDSFLMPFTPRNLSDVHKIAKTLGLVITTRKASETERRVWLVSKNGHGEPSAAAGSR